MHQFDPHFWDCVKSLGMTNNFGGESGVPTFIQTNVMRAISPRSFDQHVSNKHLSGVAVKTTVIFCLCREKRQIHAALCEPQNSGVAKSDSSSPGDGDGP